MTFAEARQQIQMALSGVYDEDEATHIASLTIAAITGANRAEMILKRNENLPSSQQERLLNAMDELKTGRPVQYVLGETDFYDLKLKVNNAVLIPRPETEELVNWILNHVSLKHTKALTILDIGTGSGCIAIALKKNLPRAEVYAIDLSPAALLCAKENALLNNVELTYAKADILTVKSAEGQPFDIIVSNPPYVAASEKSHMHYNVLDHEPHTALFVPDDDPLLFYRAIAGFAAANLKHGGWLYVEINERYGSEVQVLFNEHGFTDIELQHDLLGKNRMIRGRLTLLHANN